MDDSFGNDEGIEDILANSHDKKMNDPWKSAQEPEIVFPTLPDAPVDPLRNMIGSDDYIKSLEKKLSKMSKNSGAVKPKEMIRCLQAARDLHTSEYLSSQAAGDFYDNSDSNSHETVITSLQRKLNPERQALNALEIAPLVKDDILSKTYEQAEEKT
ncbi:hypothetical protein ACF0H5_003842 [Mactra antiquata]